MKFLILVAFCILAAASCNEKSTKSTQVVTNKESKQVYIDSKGKKYRSLAQNPENLRTPEQKQFAKSLHDVLLNGVVAENNHMVLKLSKADCIAKGMTEKDYYNLRTSIKNNNHFYDSTGIKKVAEIVEDMHRSLRGENAPGVSLP